MQNNYKYKYEMKPLFDYSHLLQKQIGFSLELITFENLAAERLRLMGFDNRLILDCFSNIVSILIW